MTLPDLLVMPVSVLKFLEGSAVLRVAIPFTAHALILLLPEIPRRVEAMVASHDSFVRSFDAWLSALQS